MKYIHGYGDYGHRIRTHLEPFPWTDTTKWRFNRLFGSSLAAKTLPSVDGHRKKKLEEDNKKLEEEQRQGNSRDEKPKTFEHKKIHQVRPGRLGDAGGFEYDMLTRILMENHSNREDPHMPFLFDGHSSAPYSTENAQYMALATFPSVFQRLVLLCQEALLGPASYLVKGSKFSTRQGSHDGTRTRFTGFFHGTSVLFMRQDHRNRLNLTNFQRYLLRLGLNFVKTLHQ